MVYVWPFSIVGRNYYRLRWSAPFYQLINRGSRRLFHLAPQALNPLGIEAVRSLATEGIFRTSIEVLMEDPEVFHHLCRDAQGLLARPDIQDKIQQRRNVEDEKWYVVRAFGHRMKHQPIPISFARFFLHPHLLGIASTYLGLQARLNYIDVWHNIPVRGEESSVTSEFWHRDHEDKRIIKVFLLLTDVDDSMGPFTYIKRSQEGGELGSLFPAIPPIGRYPKQDILEQMIKDTPLPVVSCVGPAGSLILSDTSGLHRGGRSLTKPRTVLVGFYTSNAGLDAGRYSLPDSIKLEGLSAAAKFALYS